MTKQEILEGNVLIAGFMGASYPILDKSVMAFILSEDRFPDRMYRCAPKDMQYHTSWDWLMPVVEKIESSADVDTGNCEVEIIENTCRVYRKPYIREHIKVYDGKSKIGAVWQAVVQFIQWLNEKKIKRIGADEMKHGNRAWE